MPENRPITKILGIDPGLATAGYGVIVKNGNKLSYIDSGEFKTKAKELFPDRLVAISDWLANVLEEHKPDVGVVEETFYGVNAKTALQMGHARGAIILTIAKGGVECVEYSAKKIKQSTTGRGNATKEQVAFMVKNMLGLKESVKGEHASDALATAICHANHLVIG